MATQTHASLPICDHKPAPYGGPSKKEVLALRQQYLTPGLITYYRDPLLLVEGHMQYLWDEKGKQYLDGLPASSPFRLGTAIRMLSKRSASRSASCNM